MLLLKQFGSVDTCTFICVSMFHTMSTYVLHTFCPVPQFAGFGLAREGRPQ